MSFVHDLSDEFINKTKQLYDKLSALEYALDTFSEKKFKENRYVEQIMVKTQSFIN